MGNKQIDYDRLRSDLLDFLDGPFFVGGYGAALIERARVESCSDEVLISTARRYGFPIEKYYVRSDGNGRRR